MHPLIKHRLQGAKKKTATVGDIVSPPNLGPPTTPTGLIVSPFSLAVVLTWTKNPETDIGHYQVQRADDAGFTVNVSSPLVNATAYVDKTQDTVTRYYRISAVRTSGVASPFTAGVTGAGLLLGTAQLNDAAVTTAKLANLAVDNSKLAALAVDAAKLAESAVTATKIANLAVGSAAIAALAVGTGHIADAAILTAKIGDGQIVNAKIGALAVNTANIVDLSVGTIKIANAGVNAFVQATSAGPTADINTEVDLISTAITPGNGVNSVFEIYAKIQVESTGSPIVITLRLKRGTTTLDTIQLKLSVQIQTATFSFMEVAAGTGSQTYKVTGVRDSGTGVLTAANMLIRVSDSKK